MSQKSTVVREVVMCLAGRESPAQAMATILSVITVDIIATRGITMDLIYIPDGYTLWMALVIAVFAILGPVLNALYLKTKSSHKYEDWLGKYTVTMILDMILAPIASVAVLSWIVQELPQPIAPATYTFILLPVVLLLASRYILIGLNEGMKGAAVQFNKDKAELKDAIDTVKKNE